VYTVRCVPEGATTYLGTAVDEATLESTRVRHHRYRN